VYHSLRQKTPNVAELNATLDNFQQVLDANAQELDQLHAYSPLRLKAELKAELLSELRASSMQAARPRSAAVATHEQSYARQEPGYDMEDYDAPPAQPKPWPAKVSVCLNRIGSDGLGAKSTYMRGDLLEAASAGEDSLYVLARDPQRRSLYLVIPSLDRFNSSQDYNNYSTFYDCDRPASGEVWVLEPPLASYDNASGHWRLQQKGRLQIG
jgi:hypothetical protein